ncbi:rhodanese-like domain-containing protein [Aurantibacter sp.]|uniref:rhodanese-like domain-containing protein n=1 Tax=Aurantibacter sp. TaxID=2807103 RepID=UPI0035C7C526
MKLKYILLFTLFFQQIYAQNNLDQLLKKYNDNTVPYISVNELVQFKTKPVLLDAREIEEYNISHLKNAVYVGYKTFKLETILNTIPNKGNPIVVYCSLGVRSEIIAKKLKNAGYTNVKNLYGGIFEWKNKDFSVYNNNKKETDSIHAFSKTWSKWLKKGISYYPKKQSNE